MHEDVWGPELKKLSDEQLAEAALLCCSAARPMKACVDYWTTSSEDEAPVMNSAPKAVVSTTLTRRIGTTRVCCARSTM